MKDYKLLETYQTEFEAELVRTKLERQGIESFLNAEDRSGVIPALDYSGGYQLFVEPDDYTRAKSLITDVTDNLSDDMDTTDTSNGLG